MQRRLVPVALAALLAVTAFAIAAESLDAATADGPALDGSGGTLDDVNRTTGGGGGGARESPPDTPACQNCVEELSVRSLLTDRLPTIPPPLLLVAATVGCGVLALVARNSGAGAETAVTSGEHTSAPPRPAAGSESVVTGDDVPADRPIYRAWATTLGSIEVARPAAATPAERAATARQRGWDADSVATLTTLFQRARYGGQITEQDVQRAREAAQRLRGER